MKIVSELRKGSLEILLNEIESHKERMDDTESSIVIVSLNNGALPRLTTNVKGRDRVKMVGALQLTIQDLSEELLKEW